MSLSIIHFEPLRLFVAYNWLKSRFPTGKTRSSSQAAHIMPTPKPTTVVENQNTNETNQQQCYRYIHDMTNTEKSEMDIPLFAQVCKRIYKVLKHNESDSFCSNNIKHFGAYICYRLKEANGDMGNPSTRQTNIFVTEYCDEYKEWFVTKLGWDDKDWKDIQKNGCVLNWKRGKTSMVKNILSWLPMMTPYFQSEKQKKKVTVKIEKDEKKEKKRKQLNVSLFSLLVSSIDKYYIIHG